VADISVSAAAGAGFKLIGSKPVSVFIWGLFMVLLVVAPAVALFASVMPQFVELMRDQATHPATPPQPAAAMTIFNQMGAAYSVLWLGGILSAAIVNAAVYRAVIEPRNRGFAYLRFGMREIWLIVLYIAEFLLAIVMIILAVMAVAAITAATTHFAGQSWGVLAGVVSGLLAAFGLIVVALRLSMAAPMTFADGEFRLFQSWRLTRGHAWQIFLVALLLFVILIGVGIVVNVVERLTLLPMMLTYAADPHAAEHFNATFSRPPEVWLKTAWPYILGACVGLSIYIGVMRTIVAAPWATVYRMLKGDAAAA
jgi:hypothetical protein